MIVVLTCPNCNAQMEIDENRQFIFCQYCGTKVVNLAQKVEMSGQVSVDRSLEIQNLSIRAMEFESRGDYTRAAEYCTRILDMDPTNAIARAIESRLPYDGHQPNVMIVYRSVHGDGVKLRVTLDGRNWKVLNKNESIMMTLPVGKHRIHFSGRKSYTYDVTVNDMRKRITIIYTADKHRNTIETM